MESYPSLIKIKEKNMATYRIDVPATGGTITAATFDTSCVSNVSIDYSSDPDQMIRSTGSTNGTATINCYALPSQASLRDWNFPLTYNSGSNSCSHTLHLYQEGTGPSTYKMNVTYRNELGTGITLTNIFITLGSSTQQISASGVYVEDGNSYTFSNVEFDGSTSGEMITTGAIRIVGVISGHPSGEYSPARLDPSRPRAGDGVSFTMIQTGQ